MTGTCIMKNTRYSKSNLRVQIEVDIFANGHLLVSRMGLTFRQSLGKLQGLGAGTGLE